MIEVVGIAERVRQHEGRPMSRQMSWVKTTCSGTRIGQSLMPKNQRRTENRRRFDLLPPLGLHALERRARQPPRLRGFAALAEREAHDGDSVSTRCVEGNGSPGAPHEVCGVGADHEGCL
jgi:hypothetical protein